MYSSKKCVRLVSNVNYRAHTEPLFSKLELLKFDDLFQYNVCKFFHQYRTKTLPGSFQNMFTLLRDTDNMENRDSFYNYEVCKPKFKCLNCFPVVVFPQIWNSLSSIYQSTDSFKVFKKDLKKFYVDKYSEFVSCDNLLCDECIDSN